PKRSHQLSPNADQHEVARHDAGALPKFFAQAIGLLGVSKRFAVQVALVTSNLESSGSEQFAPLAFDHLEFLEAFLQLLARQVFLLPEEHKLLQVFNRSPANLLVRCRHPAENIRKFGEVKS